MNPRRDISRRSDTAEHYRREAARLRALAETSTFSEVRDDLAGIAQDYEELAQQRDAVARRYGG